MASTRKLIDGWTLADGIFEAVVLPEPVPVLRALMDAGRVPANALYGAGSLACEWIAARAWTYEVAFDAPEEDDERCALCFECLEGRGQLFVNGVESARFEPGEWTADITGALIPGRNLASLRFEPRLYPLPESGAPLPQIGIRGSVSLRTTSYLTVERLCARPETGADGRALAVEMALTAHGAGKYVFRYLVLDGETVLARRDFYERLPAASRELRHRLELPGARAHDPRAAREDAYAVRMRVERNGLTCECFDFDLAFPEREASPLLGATISGPIPDPDVLARLRALPISYLRVAESPDRARARLPYRYGFLTDLAVDPAGEAAQLLPLPAMPRESRLLELAAQSPCWPSDQPVWRLNGCERPRPDEYEALFGAGAGGAMGRFARITRLLQAEALAREARALLCRRMGFLLTRVDEARPQYFSRALIEYGGGCRPAYWALLDALKGKQAFGELPVGGYARAGEALDVPLWLLDAPEGNLVTVEASLYSAGGALLAAASYPSGGGRVQQVAQLRLTLPARQEIYILRTRVLNDVGAPISCNDQLLCAALEGEPPLAALLRPTLARLAVSEDRVVNEGDVAALSLSTGRASGLWSGYGALLPGEALHLPGIRPEDVECYNHIMADPNGSGK